MRISINLLAYIILLISRDAAVSSVKSTGELTSARVTIKAVDARGKEIKTFRAGQYTRIWVRAHLGLIPKIGSATVSAQGKFTTSLLGRSVSYEANLPPAKFSAASTLNPAVGTKGFGKQKIGTEYENRVLQERFDLRIPPEAPAGSLRIRVKVSATGLKPMTEEVSFRVTR
jgi:hypothetical protein